MNRNVKVPNRPPIHIGYRDAQLIADDFKKFCDEIVDRAKKKDKEEKEKANRVSAIKVAIALTFFGPPVAAVYLLTVKHALRVAGFL